MKKLLLLFLVLCGGISQVSATDLFIRGTHNSWAGGQLTSVVDNEHYTGTISNLPEGADLQFKLVVGSDWKGYDKIDSEITLDVPSGWIVEGPSDNNFQLKNHSLSLPYTTYNVIVKKVDSKWEIRLEGVVVAKTTYTVHFINTMGWTNVYAYTYNRKEAGNWPGTLCSSTSTTTLNGITYDVYDFSFDSEVAPEKIFFNNGTSGETNQTAALDFEADKTYIKRHHVVAGKRKGTSDPSIFCGAWFGQDDTSDYMTYQSANTWVFKKSNVELEAQTIEFKVIDNNGTYYPGSNQEITIGNDGIYNITIIYYSDSHNLNFNSTPARETVAATVGSYGKATLCSEYALDFTGLDDEGVKAYIITAAADGILTPEQVTGKVKGGTGLYIEGTGSIDVPTTIHTTAPATNFLKGVTEDTHIVKSPAANTTNYILTINTAGGNVATPKFYMVNGTSGNTVSAGKAYLQITTVSPVREYYWFAESTTAIDAVKQEQKFDGQAYNLAGQRISQPTKGLYIVNGKKVIIK